MAKLKKEKDIFGKISLLIENAKSKIATTINEEMIVLYWNIGKIVKETIMRSDRAEYGKKVVQSLSSRLTLSYGKGFSPQNLWYMVQLYDTYPILHAVRGEFNNLSWTHIKNLLPVKDDLKRKFYAELCRQEHWNTRTLKERMNSMLYERTALSRLPEKTIENQLSELKENDKMTPELVFRDSYVLDFLELHNSYSERDLENAILNSLEKFILEFGKDFYFVERQKRFTLDGDDFYIDLVFYHRRLKCFVLIELKLGKFKAEYKGKMELYLRYMEKYEMMEGDKPPIGLILCSEKGREQVEILFLPEDKIKVSEYITGLPSKTFFAEKLNKAIRNAQIDMTD
jgi:predicted nuclease of restriction endonuclease-like (RecB) superfamily